MLALFNNGRPCIVFFAGLLLLALFGAAGQAAETAPWPGVPTSTGFQGNQQSAHQANPSRLMRFHRYLDRSEGAFLLLVPDGWTTEGGIFRVNPMAIDGAGQSIEAKIDCTLKRDPAGKVMIRFIPHTNYVMPGPYVITPVVNGMPVVPMPTPAAFLTGNFSSLRPAARNVQVLATQARPDIVQAVLQGPKARTLQAAGAQYQVDAAMVSVGYEEGGIRFKELLFTAIEGFSMMNTGMWTNAMTIVARAPADEAEAWIPTVKVVLNSFQLNPRWVEAETKGQRYRADVNTDTLRTIAQLDREIADNRARTQQSIHNENYLTLTNQEEYVNPFTNRTELGSNEWKHRWENSSGEVIYTDNGNWDPNVDPQANLQGYQRSTVRPRR